MQVLQVGRVQPVDTVSGSRRTGPHSTACPWVLFPCDGGPSIQSLTSPSSSAISANMTSPRLLPVTTNLNSPQVRVAALEQRG